MRLLHSVLTAMSFGWAICLAVAASAAPVPSDVVMVVSDSNHDGQDFISVTARNVRLEPLLAEIASRAGFRLSGSAGSRRTITVSMTSVPIETAVSRLLQHEGLSFVFVYDEEIPGRLKTVTFFGDDDRPSNSGAVAYPSGTDEVIPEGSGEFRPEAPVEKLLTWAGNRDPRMRAAALEAMSLHREDERARREILNGTSDVDPAVRLVSVGLLENEVKQWPEAEKAIITALRDPQASVRRLALMMLWETSSQALPEALTTALRDRDPGMREQATELLADTSR